MKMQKLFFLLSVALLFTGCGGKEDIRTGETGLETEIVEEGTEMEEAVRETETVGTEEAGETGLPEKETGTETGTIPETAVFSVTEEAEGEKKAQAGAERDIKKQEPAGRESKTPEQGGEKGIQASPEPKQTDSVQTEMLPQTQPAVPEPAEPQPEPQPVPEPQPASYSPGRVVELAVAKTKACGKTYIPDDLDRMLSEGAITEEDYHACYPTDGAGYLEYYVASDLNEARDVSGTVKFGSEDDIAANIAGMYGALPQQYFYIEYHGTTTYGGKECYVFYCYRA